MVTAPQTGTCSCSHVGGFGVRAAARRRLRAAPPCDATAQEPLLLRVARGERAPVCCSRGTVGLYVASECRRGLSCLLLLDRCLCALAQRLSEHQSGLCDKLAATWRSSESALAQLFANFSSA